MESAIEYDECIFDGIANPMSRCYCQMCENVESLNCARGRHCARGNTSIGHCLDYDPDTGQDRPRTDRPWYFPSAPEFLFCEDCVYEIEQDLHRPEADAHSDIVLEGNDGEQFWSIHVTDGCRFWVFITDRTPDGGSTWEREMSETWHLLGSAVRMAEMELERQAIFARDSEARVMALLDAEGMLPS